jgi:hypothetical protein
MIGTAFFAMIGTAGAAALPEKSLNRTLGKARRSNQRENLTNQLHDHVGERELR